jgi:uncharacterized membrane protein (DUF4010 family)
MLETLQPGFDRRLIGLGIAIAVGFIIGLEREWADDTPVGVRSFALIGALGGLGGLLLGEYGAWPVAAGLVALAVILGVHLRRKKHGGITTTIAALIVFLGGAAAVAGYWVHVIVSGGAVMALLHWKRPLHRWVDRIGDRDFEIIVRFALISLVILPVLPDRTYGPYDVFNPFNTWLLVVLIVGINLAGYISFRVVGSTAGAWLAGALGGLASSTATTISYAGMTRKDKGLAAVAVLVILVASTVVYARVIVELGVVSPALVPAILWPSVVFSLVLLGLAAIVHFRGKAKKVAETPGSSNPARIRQALSFGAIYVVILFVVAAVRERIGEDAILAVAAVSGLTDVDALTLSVGRLHGDGKLGVDIAWRAIFLATLSNLVFKIGAAAVLGSAGLRRWILATGGLAIGAGLLLLLLWP